VGKYSLGFEIIPSLIISEVCVKGEITSVYVHVRLVRGFKEKGKASCWKPGFGPDFPPELETAEIRKRAVSRSSEVMAL